MAKEVNLTQQLKHYFGFDTFKGDQEAIIRNLLGGNDTFVLMPTGGGKSLCYQLPSLIMDGTAIVISPLIALMKNQVDVINGMSEETGVAHYLNSSLNKSAIQQVMEDVKSRKTKLLYVAPESLNKEENVEFLKNDAKISFYAIDEAHCISEWGHDFRPEYRNIRPTINKIGNAPVIALTANAIAGAEERYLTAGFHGFLSKPIVPAQLEKMIRDFLPDHLLEYHEPDAKDEARKNRTKKIELPDIEGIDWDYALLHFPDSNMVYQTAVDFYESIGYERDHILSYYDGIESGEALEDYRIKVHSVKSMSNTIGAVALGGLAKMCEFAARDGDVDRIKVLTPILLEELDNMQARMAVLSSETEKPLMEDLDNLFAMLEMLKMSIRSHDTEQSDNVMKQIMTFSYDENIQDKINSLNLHIVNLEDEEALEAIDELQM